MLQELCFKLNLDALNVYLLEPAKPHDLLRLVDSAGLSRSALGYTIPTNSGLVGRVARERSALSIPEPAKHPDYHFVAGSGEERYATFLGIPVMDFDQLLGVLVAQTIEKKRFRLSEIDQIYTSCKAVVRASPALV